MKKKKLSYYRGREPRPGVRITNDAALLVLFISVFNLMILIDKTYTILVV